MRPLRMQRSPAGTGSVARKPLHQRARRPVSELLNRPSTGPVRVCQFNLTHPVLMTKANRGIGNPLFQVRLCAGPQREPYTGEPGEELVGCSDVAAHVQILELCGVVVATASAESAHVMPDRVGVQDPALGEVAAGALGRPAPLDLKLGSVEKWSGRGDARDNR